MSTALPMIDPSTISQNVSNSVASAIELRNVTKRFRTPTGQVYTALRDLTLNVAPGEFCAIVGPTGCGKSTTLGLISGLERPGAGEVQVMGEPVQGIDKRKGRCPEAGERLRQDAAVDSHPYRRSDRGHDAT